ncbi:3-phosphoserine/phosphohydroxythreonine transaminase [Listeria fleischmannii]|uniref:Phosphoserine aminotransferase n=1 Tax=Listeria fleischmannii TaxID=1069827 RepID=A0A841YD59_9LIST|nr:3-phosphoserine/phosphohydroxythreonine transaminase [Listeria fleischmannii]MBC1398149.1 3-phosphoserine/phosphohydroxythreonine transaminase [Listeria fleischmannii]MBC1426210.1 3-phosphoserine/phosphohydroxythreonine transaminase [Listeria fleischmannii]
MERVYNFSAGPATLPVPVLKQVQEELLSYKGSGMSVMELSHRSALFQEIIDSAEKLLRELMDIPDHYKVLFLQGGASLQFSMVPLNLAHGKKIEFVNTGSWSKKAISEAKKLPNVLTSVIASSEDRNFSYIPDIPAPSKDAAYLHITANNTIEGTAIFNVPKTGDVPLVADMSSNILASQYDVNDFGLIYAGAQKNIGPAGLTIVIVREDLIGGSENLPSMLDYKIMADDGSMHNTPPTFSIYVAKLVFEWIKAQGGVSGMEALNRRKAGLLYSYIDESNLFSSPVVPAVRSLTNIPFTTGDAELDKAFIKEAFEKGFVNLKGHRSVGGMRASLYNAFPLEGVEELVAFMKDFAHSHEGGKVHV